MGPTCHICLLRAPPFSLPPLFHPIPPDSSRRRTPTQPPLPFHATRQHATEPQPPHRMPSTHHPRRLRSVRPCSTHAVCTRVARRSVRAPPVRRHHQALPRRITATRLAPSTQQQPHAAAAPAASSRQALAKCSTNCLFEMGREKRKGKEVVFEKPVRKRTRAEREAERAEMVAKAAEEQTSGRARVRIDGPRGGVNWAFFKILKQ